MEITAPSPIGAHASLMAQIPSRKAPDVTRVESRDNTEKSRTDSDAAKRSASDDQAAKIRNLQAARATKVDPEPQTGPTPTFEVSVLEVAQDLQNILARLEASRAIARDADAVQPVEIPEKAVENDPAQEPPEVFVAKQEPDDSPPQPDLDTANIHDADTAQPT